MRKKFFSYVAGSAACAALILLSGCQQTTDQLSDITRYVEEKIAEGKGTEVKSKEQETDTEQAAVCGETEKQAEPSVEKQSDIHNRRFLRKRLLCISDASGGSTHCVRRGL